MPDFFCFDSPVFIDIPDHSVFFQIRCSSFFSNPKRLVLTVEQSRQVDEIAVREFEIPGFLLMENAGRFAANAILWGVKRFSKSKKTGSKHLKITLCCGKGNNAGDAFVVARHLYYQGHYPEIEMLFRPDDLKGNARTNFQMLKHLDIPIHFLTFPDDIPLLRSRLKTADVLVDGMLGTGTKGEPRPPFDQMIALINEVSGKSLVSEVFISSDFSKKCVSHNQSNNQSDNSEYRHPMVFALDLPSGLDADSGQPSSQTILADITITFVSLKTGMTLFSAAPFLGNICIVLPSEMGVPDALLHRILG